MSDKEMIQVCCECHQVLSDEEIYFYENRCTSCEREWLEEIDDWLRGGENAKFDAIYGAPDRRLN